MSERPNILFIMADQLAPQALSVHGNKVCKTPHIDELAEKGIIFDAAYCAYPLCAPARFSLLSGRLTPKIRAFDNANEFSAEIPTIAHYLRDLNYRTTLCGKMHFIGPDQLHGFGERLVTDVYPAGFAWTPDWDRGPSHRPAGVDLSAVLQAGPCIRSLQMDYDDEVEYYARQELYDRARDRDGRPFFLVVSFTQPHLPYTPGQEYWDRYRHEDIELPTVPEIPFEQLDPMSRGLYFAHGRDGCQVGAEQIRNVRHGYYGMISCIDDKIGRILAVLKETGLDENTIVVLTSDHGEMLGERGMWYKHCFFEWSVRVPLIITYSKQLAPRRVVEPVSHIDLLPTLLDFADNGCYRGETEEIDGQSLLPLMSSASENDHKPVISDYASIGPCVPCRMIRVGAWKMIYIYEQDPLLFNLEKDPTELQNLCDSLEGKGMREKLEAALLTDWDPRAIAQQVRSSQRSRLFIKKSLKGTEGWDFKVRPNDGSRYVRGDHDETKRRHRFPYVPAP